MKVITVDELAGTDRDVKFTGGNSLRPILAGDGMGFSLHKTIIPRGGPYHWHYKYHLEACYCVSGLGNLVDLETGFEYRINPGDLYVLDSHDDHTFQAYEDTVLISVFNPPIVGDEHHDENGVYELKK